MHTSISDARPAKLTAAEEIRLIDSSGAAIGTPSAPERHTGRLQRLHLGPELRGSLNRG